MALGPTLAGIELAGLAMPEDWEWTGIRSVVEISVGGTPNIWEGPVSGRVFTVSGGSNTGVLKKPVLSAVYELAKVLNATYPFDPGNGNTFMVRFAHHAFDKVIEADPVGNVVLSDDDSMFNNIKIHLMKVI